jgi:F-type H+-transporting ATPase subunit delta
MPHDPINAAYAGALLEMAQAEAVVTRVEEEMFRLRELLQANPALLEFLKDPNVAREGKRQALTELLGGRVHPLVLNLLIAISDVDRTNRLPHILEEFIALATASRQKVSAEIISAIQLDDATIARAAEALGRVTGKNVQLFQKVDPTILGGAIIKMGDEIIDGSIRRKLDQIQETLAR